MISPLCEEPTGLRPGKARPGRVRGLVVHTTGGGPARSAKKLGIDPTERALAYYLHGGEGFPNYLLSQEGLLLPICDEAQVANHAGWDKALLAQVGGMGWNKWQPAKWWADVWVAAGYKNPGAILRAAAGPGAKVSGVNSLFLGVELEADETGYGFTPQQYLKLAMLWEDIARRHRLP